MKNSCWKKLYVAYRNIMSQKNYKYNKQYNDTVKEKLH